MRELIVINAIMQGVHTNDVNLLIIEPGKDAVKS